MCERGWVDWHQGITAHHTPWSRARIWPEQAEEALCKSWREYRFRTLSCH